MPDIYYNGNTGTHILYNKHNIDNSKCIQLRNQVVLQAKSLSGTFQSPVPRPVLGWTSFSVASVGNSIYV